MAGMFYSLQETAERLGKTEDDVKQLAADGKLREFRDGSNLLFKIEEVNALMAEELDKGMESDIDLGLEPETPEVEAETPEVEPETPEVEDETPEPEAEAPAASDDEMDLELELEPLPEETAEAEEEQTGGLELMPEAEATSELDLGSELALEPDAEGESGQELSESDILAGIGDEDLTPAAPEETADEISLAPETGMSDADITDMDTALTGEGISILGETDADYDITEDSLAETVGPAGTSTEASLEEIEGDVNLDSFGSGSGLLDLSLQADDTSLGGILDEIYTTEDEEKPAGGDDMLDDMTAEADHVAETEMVAPEPMMAVPTVTPTLAETAPDTQSNILGTLLFLPLLVLLYASIVTISAQREFVPSILKSIQGMIWYIMGGAAFVAIAVVGVSFAIGGEKGPKTAKPKKEKKAKAKKEKPKKEKKAKAEKPKKEKKSLFGKKKKG